MNNNNRCRTNPLIKFEKEHENLELRKRLKNITKDKQLGRELVWDRQSKARRSPSSQNLGANCSKHNLSTKPSKRFQIMKQMAVNHQQQQLIHQQPLQQQTSFCRPLSANSGSKPQGSRKYRLQKSAIKPETNSRDFVHVYKPIKSFKDKLTESCVIKTKYSLGDLKTDFSQPWADSMSPHSSIESLKTALTGSYKQLGDNSEDSEDEYKLAPLMSTRSQCKHSSSANIINNVHEILKDRGEGRMQTNQMELVKNVIKFDERYPQLDNSNPQLFKDILKTQLQEILKHEYAVKEALDKMGAINSNESCQTIQPTKKVVSCDRDSVETTKFEVDVVFKNSPSLEREIIILRALGEKLEATLKRTSSQRHLHLKSRHVEVLNTSASIHPCRYFILTLESNASISMKSQGLVQVTGIAQEFRIAQKTIVELKQQANRPFYIPIRPDSAELQKTSFQKLKENPDLLMHHIKANNSTVPFNVLDQDPVFFNNFLFNQKFKSTSECSVDKSSENNEKTNEVESQPVLCEGGDSLHCQQKLPKKNFTKRKESSANNIVDKDRKLKKSNASMQTAVKGKERRRIRQSMTPFSTDKRRISPKNTLLKTILVGTVQISCFMLLIMAFTFPEAKC